MKDLAKWIPIYAALLAGCVALFVNNQTNKNSLELEKRQFESNLILKALVPNDTAQSVRNIKFLIEAGFIDKSNTKLYNIIRDTHLQVKLPKHDTVEITPANGYAMKLDDVDLFSAQLVDNNKKPIEGAQITIYKNSRSRQVYASTRSDIHGLFKIALPDGDNGIRVAIEKQGFVALRKIYLRSGIKHLNIIPLASE